METRGQRGRMPSALPYLFGRNVEGDATASLHASGTFAQFFITLSVLSEGNTLTKYTINYI